MGLKILIGCVLLVGLTGSFWTKLTPPDLLRAGNRAFDREEYELALSLYERAAEHTKDPGLVAFNRAATCYQRGDYFRAAAHYRQCLEDAANERRFKALYGLGNALTRHATAQHPSAAVEILNAAISAYADVLIMSDADDSLRDNTEFNLKQAREALARMSQLAAEERKTMPHSPDEPRPLTDQSLDRLLDRLHMGSQMEIVDEFEGAGGLPLDADQFMPGAGNLPTRLSTDNGRELDENSAQLFLRNELSRIRLNRATYVGPFAQPPSSVRDW